MEISAVETSFMMAVPNTERLSLSLQGPDLLARLLHVLVGLLGHLQPVLLRLLQPGLQCWSYCQQLDCGTLHILVVGEFFYDFVIFSFRRNFYHTYCTGFVYVLLENVSGSCHKILHNWYTINVSSFINKFSQQLVIYSPWRRRSK